MSTTYLTLLTAAIISNFVLLTILFKRRQYTISVVSFSVFILLINVWGIANLLVNLPFASPKYFELSDRAAALGYTFIPVAFLIFALSFINKLSLLKNLIISSFIFIPAITFLFLSWTTNIVENHEFSSAIKNSWGYSSPPGPLFPLFLFWFELLMILSLVGIIIFYTKVLDSFKKSQSLWIIAAIFIPLLFGTITDGILPIFKIFLFPSAVPLTSITALIITYAIFKYELFELSPLSIISSISEGVITFDNNKRILLLNDSAQKMLSLEKTNVIGKQITEVLTFKKDDYMEGNGYENLVENLFKESKSNMVERVYLVAKNKHPFPAIITLAKFKLNEKIMGGTLTFRDLTDKEELEKRKDEFISIASHELRTPITIIKIYTQFLEKNLIKDKKAKVYTEKIQSQIERLVQLINSLLDVSKIQSGKIAIKKEKLDLNELIKNIVADMNHSSSQHKITFKSTKKIRETFADKELLSRVIINLISNAIKYSPKAQKVIVNLSNTKQSQIVSVKDFGIGIPKKEQRKIFERFYRVSNAEKNVQGLGLGLYIAFQIIKLHGGILWVKSNKNKGSTFYFSIPS